MGLLIVLVLLVTTFVVVVWYQWRQDEREVVEEQAAVAESIRGRLERLRDDGRVEDADLEVIVRQIRGAEFSSVTEQPDDVYVVAWVGVPPAVAISAQSGLDYACFGFTVPAARAPVTMERLSPDEGPWPEECISSS